MHQLLGVYALLIHVFLSPVDDGSGIWPTDGYVSRTASAEFAARYKVIQQACQRAAKDDVSGLYYIGNHCGPFTCCLGCSHRTKYIAIDRTKGYVLFEIASNMQATADITTDDFGEVIVGPDARLLLCPDRLSLLRAEEKTLVPVRWGSQRYLVPESQMIEFCNRYNSSLGQGTLFGLGYLRWEDRFAKANGKPEVPGAWEGFLLNVPAEGRVKAATRLNDNDEILTLQLTFSGKDSQNLKPGMAVWLYRPPFSRPSPPGNYATVVKTDGENCVATTRTPGVTKGWGYSTLCQRSRGKLTDAWQSEDKSADNDPFPKRRTK